MASTATHSRVRGGQSLLDRGSFARGDEFVVLLSEVENSDEVAIIATRMLAAVSESRFIDQNELHVTTSIGVAVHPDDGIDAATLIENADTAMYQAKTSGSPRYRFFRPVVTSLEQNSA
jgi:diguanylate cyclase (GGDEF)-like protein